MYLGMTDQLGEKIGTQQSLPARFYMTVEATTRSTTCILGAT